MQALGYTLIAIGVIWFYIVVIRASMGGFSFACSSLQRGFCFALDI
jgi:hypothetical protein